MITTPTVFFSLALDENKLNLTPKSYYPVILINETKDNEDYIYFGVINDSNRIKWICANSCYLKYETTINSN